MHQTPRYPLLDLAFHQQTARSVMSACTPSKGPTEEHSTSLRRPTLPRLNSAAHPSGCSSQTLPFASRLDEERATPCRLVSAARTTSGHTPSHHPNLTPALSIEGLPSDEQLELCELAIPKDSQVAPWQPRRSACSVGTHSTALTTARPWAALSQPAAARISDVTSQAPAGVGRSLPERPSGLWPLFGLSRPPRSRVCRP